MLKPKDIPKRVKRGPGRPPKAGGRVKFNTTLPPAAVQRLCELGGGNGSHAILLLLEFFEASKVGRNGRPARPTFVTEIETDWRAYERR